MKKVVGVGLDKDSGQPLVVVKGAGESADWILTRGQSDETPVVRDAALVNQLYRTPVDTPISRDLFPVMAVLLAHILRVDKEHRE